MAVRTIVRVTYLSPCLPACLPAYPALGSLLFAIQFGMKALLNAEYSPSKQAGLLVQEGFISPASSRNKDKIGRQVAAFLGSPRLTDA